MASPCQLFSSASTVALTTLDNSTVRVSHFLTKGRMCSGSPERLVAVLRRGQVDDRAIGTTGGVVGDDHHHVAVGTELLQRVEVLAREHLLVEPLLALIARQRDHVGGHDLLAGDLLGHRLAGRTTPDDLIRVSLGLRVDLGGLRADPSRIQVVAGLLDPLARHVHSTDGRFRLLVEVDVADVDTVDDDAVLLPALGEERLDVGRQHSALLLDGEGFVVGGGIAGGIAGGRPELALQQVGLALELVVDPAHGVGLDRVADHHGRVGRGTTLETQVDLGPVGTGSTVVGEHLDPLVADVEGHRRDPGGLGAETGVGIHARHTAAHRAQHDGLARILGVEGAQHGDDQGDAEAHPGDPASRLGSNGVVRGTGAAVARLVGGPPEDRSKHQGDDRDQDQDDKEDDLPHLDSPFLGWM